MPVANEEKILDRVRKLLDRANHPGTPEPERDACIAKADSLMLKHAIDEALLDANKKGDQRTPVTTTFRAYSEYEFSAKFQTMLWSMAETLRCRAAVRYNGDTTVVGMQDDVQYFEMLWTTVYLSFVSKIYPRWNDNLSFDHNVYNFKKAGFKWPAIRETAVGHGHWVEWPDGGFLIRAYKRHAKMVGDESLIKTQRHNAYRASFAEGFVQEICAKLEQMRENAKNAESQGAPGTALALVSVEERVNEQFYEQFPHHRPMSQEDLEAIREKRRKEREEEEARVAAMSPAERKKWEDEQEKERRRQAKASDRFWRDQERRSSSLYDPSGVSAGRQAGAETDLSGGSGQVGGNTDPKGIQS